MYQHLEVQHISTTAGAGLQIRCISSVSFQKDAIPYFSKIELHLFRFQISSCAFLCNPCNYTPIKFLPNYHMIKVQRTQLQILLIFLFGRSEKDITTAWYDLFTCKKDVTTKLYDLLSSNKNVTTELYDHFASKKDVTTELYDLFAS